MQYLGGKSKTRNQIAAYLNRIRQPGQAYWEPFVGAGWVLEKIKGQPIYASDANPYLIAMWEKLQDGWEPPSVVTEEEYQEAKKGNCEPHLRAFIGFGCSFGGKWFAGYARAQKTVRNHADEGSRRLRRTANYARIAQSSVKPYASRLDRPCFFVADFLTFYPPAPNLLIYCDPPYQDTTAYGTVPPFDSALFWERVRQLEKDGHTVVVSEYQAPPDFSCVLEIITKTGLRTTEGKSRRVEKLFRLGEHQLVQPRLF